MITVNRIGESITGSFNNQEFGVKFTEDKYKKMQELAAKADAVDTMEEYMAIIEEFKPLTVESFKEVVETECPYIYVNEATGEFFLKTGDVVSSVPLPNALVERIKTSYEKGIDFMPLVKLWTRWLRNPVLRGHSPKTRKNFSKRFANYINATFTNYEKVSELMNEHGLSREVAIERSTTYQVKITQEGLMNTFKVSREKLQKYALDENGNKIEVDRYPKTIDPESGLITTQMPEIAEDRVFAPAVMGNGGDEFYCGDMKGHIIKVGKVHRLESWDQVDTNNDRSCVPGLHVGGLDYIKGYQGTGTETHNVFVDPMHIGAIPDDHTGAIRCIQYFVHSVFGGVNGSIYHSSKYAELTDAEWKKMREEAIAEFGEFSAEVTEEAAKWTSELEAL